MSALSPRTFVVCLGCAAWLLACSGNDGGNDEQTGGSVATNGGASASGGASGGGSASGGASSVSGGTSAASGGASSGGSGVGGAITSGGATSASGGASANGGTSALSGGQSSQGGASTAGGMTALGGTSASSGGKTAAGGSSASGGKANSSGGAGGASMTDCPYSGHITYTLARSANPTTAEQDAYTRITAAMDKAITYYDCYTNITKSLNVSYVASVATADGSSNGSIRFGSDTTYMDYRSAMHEIAHTVGIGTASNWGSFVTSDKLFTGKNANAELDAINMMVTNPDYTDVHADNQHFWPYGINYQSEVHSEADLLYHCRMVMAIRKDLGLN